MIEGINDIDEFDDDYDLQESHNPLTSENLETTSVSEATDELTPGTIEENNPPQPKSEQDDFLYELLKSRGILDPTKIKFENDSGDIEEIDWYSLDTKDKLSILNSSTEEPEENLDASEIELINAIRESLLTPMEYMQNLQRSSIEEYLKNSQNLLLSYSIDLYSDEELYVMDFVSKSTEFTEEEALEALERAKSNEVLFKKLMEAIRNEYKRAEEESIQYTKLKQELEAQELFDQYAEKIEDSILNFKEFSGCELNMSDLDMEDLYNFIVGFDKAGNNWFGKALSDPENVVQMAWFLLNGEKMISDINEYYLKEITNVRKESYNKGLQDAAKKGTSIITYKPKGLTNTQTFDDLDDF